MPGVAPCLGIQQYCWQFLLVLDHTIYATVCWAIQRPSRCVDFLSFFSANEEQLFKDKGTLVGYLRLLSHLLPPSSNYPLQAPSCPGRMRTSFISAYHWGSEGKWTLGIFTLKFHTYQRALFSLFPWSQPWGRRQNRDLRYYDQFATLLFPFFLVFLPRESYLPTMSSRVENTQ